MSTISKFEEAEDRFWDAVEKRINRIQFLLVPWVGPHHYNVIYRFSNGMTVCCETRRFMARNDRIARRQAQAIAGKDSFAVELKRIIRIRYR